MLFIYCDTNIFYEQIIKFYICVSQCVCVCVHEHAKVEKNGFDVCMAF